MRDSWIVKLVSTCSQAFNALVLNGHQDESVSARAYREEWRIRETIDLVFWLIIRENDHCRNAFWSDVERAKWLVFRSELIRERKKNHAL